MKKLLVASILAFAVSCGKPASEQTPEPPKEITQYSIEQFYKNESVTGGSFSNDETRLIVSSNKQGSITCMKSILHLVKKHNLPFLIKNLFLVLMKSLIQTK